MHIRPASSADAPAIWSILEPTIRVGETYTLDRNLSQAVAIAYWMGADKEVFVAEEAGAILGTYYIRPNQAGGGRHVCNCLYETKVQAIATRLVDKWGSAKAQTRAQAVARRCAGTRAKIACDIAMSVRDCNRLDIYYH
ncbi:hypothetical protein MesoLj131a_67300 (plasmid) [Mesorhizobium sp. 131-2-1]|nr:hypothetical protein MesoLj131a_67300 [Mesorhizobium sp. 131-2-1]